LKITYKRCQTKIFEKNSEEVIKERRLLAIKLLSCYKKKYYFIYLDETSFNAQLRSLYGHSLKGQAIKITTSKKSFNYSVIASMDSDGIIGIQIFKYGINRNGFVSYIQDLILLEKKRIKKKKPILFMDNASIHKFGLVKNVLQTKLLFLYNTPYSPELNPIELVFAKVKKTFRKLMHENVSSKFIPRQIYRAFQEITTHDVQSFIYHSVTYLKKSFNKNKF
jgi:transposase